MQKINFNGVFLGFLKWPYKSLQLLQGWYTEFIKKAKLIH